MLLKLRHTLGDLAAGKGGHVGEVDAASSELEGQRVAMLYAQMPHGLVATVVNAAILFGIEAPALDYGWLTWGWLVTMGLVCLARVALFAAYSRTKTPVEDATWWKMGFVAGVFAIAVTWGSAALVLFPFHSFAHQAFLGFVLAGMAAGAMGSFLVSFRIYLCMLLPAIGPYAVQLFVQGDRLQVAMGAMSVIFIVVMAVTSKKSSSAAISALKLQHENDGLVAHLTRVSETLRATNRSMEDEIGRHQATQAKLMQAKSDADAATQAKSLFLANMSHEIRTPMNGVLGMTDILKRTALDQRQKRLLATIQESGHALLNVINGVLDISRIEAGKLELDVHEFNLVDCAEQVVELLAETARAKNLVLALHIAEDVPKSVKGDGGRVRQVLINLIGNAIKFTQHGEVVVRLTRVIGDTSQSRVKFEVSDTGIGLDPATKNKLFQPFAQADTTVTRRFGGAGLGLSISQHLIQMMGGQIGIESELGQGCQISFTVRLEHATQVLPSVVINYAALADARILVIDDRATNREIFVSYLEAARSQVVAVSSAAAGWSALVAAFDEKRAFHAVIVDMMMPDENGVELTRRITADARLAGVRIIMATSANWPGDVGGLRELGVAAFLTKPVRRHDLLDEAAKVVGQARGMDHHVKRHAVATVAHTASSKLAGLRVLVAEDNPVNIEVAREFLTGLGCTVTIAEDGTTALQMWERDAFDVILMDYHMPVMDGLSTTRAVRAREKVIGPARLPIIAVTANAYAEDRQKCVDAGMDDHLSKPFTEAQLEAVLVKWAGERTAVRTVAHLDAPIKFGANATVEADYLRAAGLDPDVLGALKGGRPGIFERLVKIYFKFAPTAVAELKAASGRKDSAAVGMAAHSLKSSSANVGAVRVSQLCTTLEAAVRDGEHALQERLIGEIERALLSVSAVLDDGDATKVAVAG
jgi:two-component system, sensor histidine kinase and response regulator